MRIQHNIMAMNAYRNLNMNNNALSGNLEKLSSGYRINRAGDDAAGLAISEKMRMQITGLDVAQDNAQSGINLVQTAEGALTEVHDMLNRMYELAEQAANGTIDNTTDRKNLEAEMDQLKEEINRIAGTTNFNGISLFGGSDDTGSGALTNASFSMESGLSSAQETAFNSAFDGGKDITITIQGTTNASGVVSATGTANASGAPAGYTITLSGTVPTAAGNLTFNVTAGGSTVGTITVAYDPTKLVDGANTTTVNIAPTGGGGGDITIPDGEIWVQIGEDSNALNRMKVEIGAVDTTALGIADVSIADQSGALNALSDIEAAINKVSSIRGSLGATQNRLEHTINNLAVTQENIQEAESTIRDTDVADEMMEYTKNNILIQSAQAMLAQANQAPQGVLQLLQ